MQQFEIERVFLVNRLPKGIGKKFVQIRVGDFFHSNDPDALKIKQKGDHYHLIKKVGQSSLGKTEHIIDIKKGEFDALWKATIQNHEKLRFYIKLGDKLCEIDYYQGRLNGYIRAEIEFDSVNESKKFKAPNWFAEEITDFNHEIHENLGEVTFNEMKKRYSKIGITLKKIHMPNTVSVK